MNCHSTSGLLDAYLDNELTPQQSADLQEHLKECTHCSAHIAETARLQRALRGARSHFAPSPEFRRRIQSQLARPARRGWFRFGIPAVAILATAAALLMFLWVARPRSYDATAEFADLHINALASANQVDVISTDRHTVKPWFQGKIPFTFNVPDFNGTDFSLIGGRLVYFHQQPGAHLIVSMRQHKISVLIFQNTSDVVLGLPNPAQVDRSTSFGMKSWHSANLRFVLISDVDSPSIERLASLLKEANP